MKLTINFNLKEKVEFLAFNIEDDLGKLEKLYEEKLNELQAIQESERIANKNGICFWFKYYLKRA